MHKGHLHLEIKLFLDMWPVLSLKICHLSQSLRKNGKAKIALDVFCIWTKIAQDVFCDKDRPGLVLQLASEKLEASKQKSAILLLLASSAPLQTCQCSS